MAIAKTLELRQLATDFTLPDQHDTPFQLSDAWNHHHTVLCFMAAPQDPAMQQFGTYLARRADSFLTENAQLVFVVQGDKALAATFARQIGHTGPVLADPDFSLYQQYKLQKVFNPTARSGFVVVATDATVTYIRSLMDFWGWRQEARLLSEHVRGLNLRF